MAEFSQATGSRNKKDKGYTNESIHSIGDKVYRMPAEWTAHEACLLLYPHNPSTFRLDLARREVEQIAQTIAVKGQEKVILYCHSQNDLNDLQTRIQHDKISVELCPSNDTWARDTAPTFVLHPNSRHRDTTTQQQQEQQLIGLNWDFNAYGGPEEGCYWPCDLDNDIAPTICRQLNLQCQSIPVVLEGGSIHVDGEGTILATKECLLNPNRNPTYSQEQLESILLSYLGGKKVIWLPFGVAFDEDTNGHIDNWACFVCPAHVVLAWTDDKEQDTENYHRCREAFQLLSPARDAQGRTLTIHKLYLPRPIFYSRQEVESLAKQKLVDGSMESPRSVGERMAASYVNFYIANQAVIVPQFGDDLYDAKAIETLTPLFPERTIVGCPSREILIGGGNIHCITQQFPKLPALE